MLFWFDKGEYFINKTFFKFTLLSNLIVLQKVVYLIRRNQDNHSSLSLFCLVYGFPLF